MSAMTKNETFAVLAAPVMVRQRTHVSTNVSTDVSTDVSTNDSARIRADVCLWDRGLC